MKHFAFKIGDRVNVRFQSIRFTGEIIGIGHSSYIFNFKGEETYIPQKNVKPIPKGFYQKVCSVFGHMTPSENYRSGNPFPWRTHVGKCPRCGQEVTWGSSTKVETLKEIY